HGTAFDIAYKGEANTLSYINAIKSAVGFIEVT
ncbi:MAG: 4-hydroxythreonine-4-phosphate dehydrogenase PdxA, partial [Sulfurimonas sp.]|nr:4-hydroxythreonine-4-phosphate dehydrogenase PdxA [Sulfurimonas sp.]